MRCMAVVGVLWLMVMLYYYEPKSSVERAKTNPLVDGTNSDWKLDGRESSAAPFSHPSTLFIGDSHSAPGGNSRSAYHVSESRTTVVEGAGEMGRPVKLGEVDAETKQKVDKGWQDHAFNQYVSDLISVYRTLPDQRLVIFPVNQYFFCIT